MPAQTKIKVRRGSTSAWAAGGILESGEIGFDSTTGKLKIGDGSTAFASLVAKADTADTLATARTINGVSFNGSANINVNTVNSYVLKFDTGTTEGTDLYTFNGSSAKTVDIKAGTGVTLTKTAGAVTISSADTNWYPTTFAWTNGTTAGPTGSLTGTGMSPVSFPAIPAAGASTSGVITTGTQTIFGSKTFYSPIIGSITGNAASATLAINIFGGVKGDLLYQSASGTTAKLALGTNNQVLTVNGTTGLPQWVDATTIPSSSATQADTLKIQSDTSTDASMYLTWINAASFPTYNDVKVTSSLRFNPFTNTLSSTNFSGALSGNATTATALATARAINGVNFDGSSAITIKASTTYALGLGSSALTFSSGTTWDGGTTGITLNVASASTSTAGVVQLSSATNSTSTSLAATASAVKSAYDLASSAAASALDALSTQGGTMSGAIAMGSNKITGLGTPTADTDAANKAYVDAAAAGIDWKQSVRVATLIPGTLSTAFANGQIVDGVTLATNDRILIKNQSTGSQNGIYTVNATGAPTRATDADTSAELSAGVAVFVEEGSQGDTGWVLTTNNPITVGTTALTFTQFSGVGEITAGTGLEKVGTTLNVTTIPVANGGTGQTSYTNGQLLIGNTSGNTLVKSTLTAGNNVTITNGAGSIQIAAADTNDYPTAVTIGGTAAAPTIGLTMNGATTVTAATIPVANNSGTSGIVNNSAQSFAGLKTFSGGISTTAITLNGTAISATAAELNKLSGVTTTATQLNYLSGATGTTGTGSVVYSASPQFSGTVLLGTGATLMFEGATSDAYETVLTVADPTADRTITLPNADGTVALTSSDITGNAATATAGAVYSTGTTTKTGNRRIFVGANQPDGTNAYGQGAVQIGDIWIDV